MGIIGGIVEVFAEDAWQEAGLTTQPVMNKIFVQTSAREGWRQSLDSSPQYSGLALDSMHSRTGAPLRTIQIQRAINSGRTQNGIIIIGAPLGFPDFIESYLFGKVIKHRQLLSFIEEVVADGLPKKAVAMLTGAASKRLTHLLKTVKKNPRGVQ
jgi:hypothetical protein